MPKRSVSAEIVTILAPGEAPLPQRRSGAAQDRAVQLVELLQELTGEGASLVELNFQKSIEARAPASIKALAVDLDCYARGSVAKIVKLEHAWRRLDGRNDYGFQVAPFPG